MPVFSNVKVLVEVDDFFISIHAVGNQKLREGWGALTSVVDCASLRAINLVAFSILKFLNVMYIWSS